MYAESVPIIPEARDLAAAGVIPGGTKANMDYVVPYVRWGDAVSEIDHVLLCDAQTSGGLILAVPQNEREPLLAELLQRGLTDSRIIGEITEAGNGTISVQVR